MLERNCTNSFGAYNYNLAKLHWQNLLDLDIGPFVAYTCLLWNRQWQLLRPDPQLILKYWLMFSTHGYVS